MKKNHDSGKRENKMYDMWTTMIIKYDIGTALLEIIISNRISTYDGFW